MNTVNSHHFGPSMMRHAFASRLPLLTWRSPVGDLVMLDEESIGKIRRLHCAHFSRHAVSSAHFAISLPCLITCPQSPHTLRIGDTTIQGSFSFLFSFSPDLSCSLWSTDKSGASTRTLLWVMLEVNVKGHEWILLINPTNARYIAPQRLTPSHWNFGQLHQPPCLFKNLCPIVRSHIAAIRLASALISDSSSPWKFGPQGFEDNLGLYELW